MLDWIHQTLAGPRADAFVPMPRFGHPDIAESVSASAGLPIRGRKRFERRASTVDELNRVVLAAGGAGGLDADEEERAAVAF